MHWAEAIILGIIQGLTEFLPVSSSGHLELGKTFFGIDAEKDLAFTIVVHGATVLSTLTVYFHEIAQLLKNSVSLKYNESQKYILKIGVSMIPVLIVGLFFKDAVGSLFGDNIKFVGYMLLITAFFLLSTIFIEKHRLNKNISWGHALILGIAQAIAVLPGISRSGITITTGLLLGNNREETAKFSFLMVIVPVIGANLLELKDSSFLHTTAGTGSGAYFAGFIAAFISGILACKWMINLVKKGNLMYFSIYCCVAGLCTIIFT